MDTKLTPRLDEDLIQNAKRYSSKSGKSVSRFVAGYFALIDAGEEVPGAELTPLGAHAIRRLDWPVDH